MILVLPGRNAASGRSFSLLRLAKSYLHATTSQYRLKHLMILCAWREHVDELNVKDVARLQGSLSTKTIKGCHYLGSFKGCKGNAEIKKHSMKAFLKRALVLMFNVCMLWVMYHYSLCHRL